MPLYDFRCVVCGSVSSVVLRLLREWRRVHVHEFEPGGVVVSDSGRSDAAPNIVFCVSSKLFCPNWLRPFCFACFFSCCFNIRTTVFVFYFYLIMILKFSGVTQRDSNSVTKNSVA